MTPARYCHQAFINLNASKLRSFLAVLGILVGTAAVVALLSCGQLATEKALEQFKTLGTDLLSITLFEKSQQQKSGKTVNMSLELWNHVVDHLPAVKKAAPYGSTYQTISFSGHLIQGSIIGADQRLAQIIKISLQKGHFVSFVDTYEHYCVLGASVAKTLQTYTTDSLINQQLQIGSALYTIIGIANPWQENGFFNEDINQSIIIPIKGLMLVNNENRINNAIMLLHPDTAIEPVIEQTKKLIHTMAPQLTVFARSAKQIIASMESQGQIFTLLLAVIGSISLVVGGIGVMNIMLVSVSERKKEIGIRKAVGAKNREIQTLFLVESIILSLFGGGCGVIMGLLITWIVAFFSDWSFRIYGFPPIAGFTVSAITGVFCGFYPARRAAKLEPMISLRNE